MSVHERQIPVRVTRIVEVASGIKQFYLEHANGRELPAFSGGSHVVVTMTREDGTTHKNPYSLLSDPARLHNYQIAVRRQEASRGGSTFMHDDVKVGTLLEVSYPANLFPLARFARHHILIAGGIGITPFLSQLYELSRGKEAYELHYAARSRRHLAFAEQLLAAHAGRVQLYAADQDQRLKVSSLLQSRPAGSHVYVCGPRGLVEDVRETARRLGWTDSHVHAEEFLAPPTGAPFSVTLARQGLTLEVPGNGTILETLEAAGIAAPCMCRGGVCGACETAVLSGEIEHHDHVLTEHEKAAGNRVLICVSRAKSGSLVLDL